MDDASRDWQGYYKAVEGRPPRHTLLWALEALEIEGLARGVAIDLGAGAGRDTLELLRRGWSVLAIDGAASGLRRLEQLASPTEGKLTTGHIAFEEVVHLPSADLVNASFSLPFCQPEAFPRLWKLIRLSLRPGGRFAGQLLGKRDDWASDPGISAFSETEVRSLLEGYQLERVEEEKHAGTTAKGKSKFWHLYHIVLKREPT